MASLALIGPGAIGCTLAAWLLKAGHHDLVICARTPFADLVVETPRGTLRESVRVVTDPAHVSPVDWVLVATKAYDAAGAAAWLPALVGPHTRVAILQNGVEHRERFAPWVAPEALVPVMVDIPCERTAPGQALQRACGRLVVADDAAGRAFVALWRDTPMTVETTPNLPEVLWRKLCLNSVGILNAILLQGPEVFHRESVATVARGLVREVIAVARSEGVMLEDEIADRIVDGCRRAPAGSLNSLHADRLAGRPMEIDARNGVILRKARAAGGAVPYHETTVAMLEAMAATDQARR